MRFDALTIQQRESSPREALTLGLQLDCQVRDCGINMARQS